VATCGWDVSIKGELVSLVNFADTFLDLSFGLHDLGFLSPLFGFLLLTCFVVSCPALLVLETKFCYLITEGFDFRTKPFSIGVVATI
jgi:hypothetical protein